MSTTLFRRPPFRAGPGMPQGEIALQEPPALPDPGGGSWVTMLTTLPMALGSGAMVLLFVQPGAKVIGYMVAGMMALSMGGMMVGQLLRASGDRKRRIGAERRDYLRHLSQIRRRARTQMVAQRTAMLWSHPTSVGLWSLIGTERMWERRPNQDAFGEVRIATGDQRFAVRIRLPQTKPIEDLDPVCAGALRRFVRAYTVLEGLPAAVALRAFSRVQTRGDAQAARALIRALLAQLAVAHSPDDVKFAFCTAGAAREAWDWAKWLPHTQHPTSRDAAGPVRLAADSLADLERLFGPAFAERPRFEAGSRPAKDEPYLVIVVDGVDLPPASRLHDPGIRNVTVLDVDGALPWTPDSTALLLDVMPSVLQVVAADRSGKETLNPVGRPDGITAERARLLAVEMARFRLGTTAEATDPLSTDIELTTLLGIDSPLTFDPTRLWSRRSPRERLRVPIGVDDAGAPVELDIKESAQGGMGPHGMLIGATGSGKSELLRTLVLALALTHSSEVLNFVLVDFKGGATFIGLEELQHTSAVITNLADALPLVDRMQAAIQGELVRRQELLRAAGYSSLLDYEKARTAGAPLDPLPTLFVIVDEFSEMLSSKRELMDLFVMIGRLGRSLGVHLLLASQRLDEGRVHMLESHLSYRIGLRTFSAAESRTVLGVPSAYELPPFPGNGFLKSGTVELTRFRAAYVSGPVADAIAATPTVAAVSRRVVPYALDYIEIERDDVAPVQDIEAQVPDPQSQATLMRALLDRLVGVGPPAHQVWLPPLSEPPTLDVLLPALEPDDVLGLHPRGWPHRGQLSVPLGIVDRPFEGTHELLTARLAGGAGHVGIVGAPRSGKSTLVRTLIGALALTHTAREVQFYCLDFGGGVLGALAELPHVGSVASRMERDRVGRTLAELTVLLAQRERTFTAAGVESMDAYRARCRAGEFAGDAHGDVFLIIDGWFILRQEFEELEPAVAALANRGLSFGIHVVVTATRWSEIRTWLRDLLGTRFELHLGEASESEVGSKVAATVPTVPGRGITADGMHFLTALPRIDGSPRVEDLTVATRDLADAVADWWTGPRAPAVRMLPERLSVQDLPPAAGDLAVAIGLDQQLLAPVWLDFDAQPHLIVLGGTESGKTNLLRLVARAVEQRYPLSEARIMLADYRRELYGSIPPQRQLGYAVSGAALGDIVAEAAAIFKQRQPGPEITPERLKLRDWWQGPRLFIMIDDYDLVATGTNPLLPLLDLLALGADIGLHLIVARTTSGAARAMLDPLMRRLWDTGTPALLLSCSREEGQFLGGEAKPLILPPGRGQLITRKRGVVLTQTGLVDTPPGRQ